MTIQVARLFQPRVTAFWATTYSFALELFDQFLLGRLGDPPLNAVVLVDQRKAAELWTGLGAEEAWRARRANSDYLVRGLRSAGGGAFHPKTYLFGAQDGGTLLVGSGNLTLDGFEHGREAFVRFESSDSEGLAAIRAWHGWIALLVEQSGDEQLSRRLTALRLGCPWLVGESGSELFVTNEGRSLVDAFVERLEPPVDELHVCAPFYDRDLSALRELSARTRPHQIHIYVGERMSVDGAALAGFAQDIGSANVVIKRLEPHRFVHAKFVAAVTGDQGLLLSGSANLSRPALLLSSGEQRANVEAGVLAAFGSDLIRDRLIPPESDYVEVDLEALRELEFAPSPESSLPRLSLLSATPLSDWRIRVTVRGELPNGEAALAWQGGSSQLAHDGTTLDPIDPEAAPVLVWLADEKGDLLSNRVPLDDLTSLERSLRARRDSTDRPRELESRDAETPVGRVLLFLNETCILDIDETPASRDAQRASEDEADKGDPEFWDRLAREALGMDHRADSYKRLRDRAAMLEDDLFSLLSIMLDRAPGEIRLRLLAGGESGDEHEPGKGTPWTADARIRVRVTNVLRRWSRALADPRLRWLGPFAPVRNYVALLIATGALWQEDVLDETRAIAVMEDLFGGFVRRERSPGYLATLDDAERPLAVDVVPDEARELAAGLLYCALRPEASWARYIFDWQPFVIAGLEWDLFKPGPRSLDAVEWVIDRRPDLEEVEERLQWAADYINDERWAAQTAKELGLEQLELAHLGFSANYPVRLVVGGVTDPLHDPKLLIAARQALAYRKSDGITLEVGAARLSLKLQGKAAAKTSDGTFFSGSPVEMGDLQRAEADGAGWGSLLGNGRAGAAA